MQIENNLYEYWIHRYAYTHEKKRKQFKRLLKEGKVVKITAAPYDTRRHFVYQAATPIKVVKG